MRAMGQSPEVAARHHLPPRHLEPVLQALVREGILKGVRGPHGGYKLAREARRITAQDILRAARTIDNGTETPIPRSHHWSAKSWPRRWRRRRTCFPVRSLASASQT